MKSTVLALMLAWALPASKAADIPDIRLRQFAAGFKQPVHVAGARDGSGRLYVVEQAGVVRILESAGEAHPVFLDLRDRVESGGEKGLFSVAFHPRFKENRRLFVNYTTKKERQLWTHISEFRANAGATAADPATEHVLLEFQQPYGNHNGGHVLFGPDGYLYIGNGDGGSANDPQGNGQRLDTLLGKIIRIDVDRKGHATPYAIPLDNPFVGRTGACPEIYAYGFRNPWRMCFDAVGGAMYCGDVGQWKWEEVDLIQKGKNYGWRIMEGAHCNHVTDPDCDPAGLEPPIAEYDRASGISVTGGHVYRGKMFPALDGVYFYADFGSGSVWGLRHDGTRVTETRQVLASNHAWSSFGEDDAGELYLVSHAGRIFRVEPKGP